MKGGGDETAVVRSGRGTREVDGENDGEREAADAASEPGEADEGEAEEGDAEKEEGEGDLGGLEYSLIGATPTTPVTAPPCCSWDDADDMDERLYGYCLPDP